MASHTRILYVPHEFREIMSSAWIPNWADLIQRGTIDYIYRDQTVPEFLCFDRDSITTVVAELRKLLQGLAIILRSRHKTQLEDTWYKRLVH